MGNFVHARLLVPEALNDSPPFFNAGSYDPGRDADRPELGQSDSFGGNERLQ